MGVLFQILFKILPMLMEFSILLMGNTVEMAGGDIYMSWSEVFLILKQGEQNRHAKSPAPISANCKATGIFCDINYNK